MRYLAFNSSICHDPIQTTSTEIRIQIAKSSTNFNTLWIFIYLLCEAVTLKNEIILRVFCCSSHRFYVLSGNGVPRLTANYTVCVSVCASLYSSFRFGGLFAKRNNNQPSKPASKPASRPELIVNRQWKIFKTPKYINKSNGTYREKQ